MFGRSARVGVASRPPIRAEVGNSAFRANAPTRAGSDDGFGTSAGEDWHEATTAIPLPTPGCRSAVACGRPRVAGGGPSRETAPRLVAAMTRAGGRQGQVPGRGQVPAAEGVSLRCGWRGPVAARFLRRGYRSPARPQACRPGLRPGGARIAAGVLVGRPGRPSVPRRLAGRARISRMAPVGALRASSGARVRRGGIQAPRSPRSVPPPAIRRLRGIEVADASGPSARQEDFGWRQCWADDRRRARCPRSRPAKCEASRVPVSANPWRL